MPMLKPFHLPSRARARLVAALCALATGSQIMAATITWQNGSGTNNWNNTAQWGGGTAPGSGDTARFNANTSEDPIINGNYTVGQLLFTTGSDAEAFTGTNTLTLAGISGVGIDNQGTVTHTFANRFAITSSQTWRNTNATNGDMTFSSTVNLNANALTLTNTNAANSMSFSGVISGTGSLTASGNGSLTLSGNNTFSGGTTLSAGTLTVANNNALGTGALAITGAATLTASGSRTLSNTVNASSDFTVGGSSNLTLSGAINLGSGNRTLTVSNTGTTTLSGVVDNAYYANFTKAGNGRLVLSGNNTFDGSFLLNAGTVALQNSNALGSSTYGNVVASGATLEFSNNISVSEGAFTITGTGVGGSVGAIHNLSGANSLSTQLTLGGATTITSTAGTLTVNGQVAIGGNTLTVGGAGNLAFTDQINGTGNLTKTGAGIVTLSGANSYTGATTISAGTLRLSGSNERISNDSDVSVASGATFDINGITETVGSITGSGSITLGTGTLRANADNSSSTFSGVISGTGGNFEKIGSGTLTLSGANTFTGTTSIAGGTLTLGASERLADSSAVSVTGGATFNLAGFTETVGSIAGNANITLGSGSLVAGGDNTSTTFSGVISGTSGTLTKQGTGTLTLSGTNTYTGLTTVSNGTLNIQNNSALGTSAAGTTVSSGATLSLQGGITVTDEALTLTGTGASGAGALRNVADTNTWNGNVTLGGNTTVISAGGTLNIGGSAISGIDTFSVGSNQLTFNTDGGNIDIRAGLTGSSPGTITKTGTGTLTLSGADNSFSGTYQINDGQVTLATPSYLGAYVNKGIQGDVTIGDNTGAAGSASLVFSTVVPGNNRIADTVNIRVNSDGLFNLAGRSDAIAALTIQGGDVTTGVGTLDLGGNVSFLSSAREATISGFLGLGGVVRTFDVASGTSAHISATINAGGILKTGDGTLILSSNDLSTYAGTTTVNGGVLNVRADNALGQGNSSSLSSRTEINAGGALELQNNVSIAAEYLQLGSTGVGGAGGLRSVSGSNTWSGSIALDGTSRINTDSGSNLTLNGVTLSMSTFDLTVGGAGNTTISKDISSDNTTPGNLIKDGTGTLFLSGNNTYRGQTQITNGIVNISSSDALGSTASNTVISSGATLQLQGGISSGEAISLAGTGYTGTSGVIQNVSGNNTISGAVTMTGASRIASDSGTLTLSGGMTGSGQALTVAGAGNTTISGSIATGTGTVTKEGSGTLTLSGVNSYTGTTQVNAGTLAFGTVNALGTSNLVATASGAIVDLNGFNQSLGSISGTGTIDFGGAQLTLNGASTFAGVFDGSGTLVLNAGSSLTLGANFNNSNLNIVLNGGTLLLNNTSNTFGSLTVTAASILDFGSGASVGQFSSVTANATLTVNNWVNTVDYFYSTANAGVMGQSPLNNIVFAGWTGNNTTWQPYDSGPNNDNQIVPVPEPEVYGAAFVSSLLALVAWRRRQTASAKR